MERRASHEATMHRWSRRQMKQMDETKSQITNLFLSPPKRTWKDDRAPIREKSVELKREKHGRVRPKIIIKTGYKEGKKFQDGPVQMVIDRDVNKKSPGQCSTSTNILRESRTPRTVLGWM